MDWGYYQLHKNRIILIYEKLDCQSQSEFGASRVKAHAIQQNLLDERCRIRIWSLFNVGMKWGPAESIIVQYPDSTMKFDLKLRKLLLLKCRENEFISDDNRILNNFVLKGLD